MEDFIPIFAIFAVFGSLTAIVVGPNYLKARERREVQKTVRMALDKGQPLPPEVIDALSKDITRRLPSRTRDIRNGVIWLAVGFGIAAFSLVSNSMSWDGRGNIDDGLLGIACIPATVGLAFLVLSFFNKNKD
jgi:hypothetical protein